MGEEEGEGGRGGVGEGRGRHCVQEESGLCFLTV